MPRRRRHLKKLRQPGAESPAACVKVARSPVEIWFQDEARADQQGTLSYVWAPLIGTFAGVKGDNCHDFVYLVWSRSAWKRATGAAIDGAGGQQRGDGRAPGRDIAPRQRGAHAVVVCDGAGWHQPGAAWWSLTT